MYISRTELKIKINFIIRKIVINIDYVKLSIYIQTCINVA